MNNRRYVHVCVFLCMGVTENYLPLGGLNRLECKNAS
jgi:hypothetical protein